MNVSILGINSTTHFCNFLKYSLTEFTCLGTAIVSQNQMSHARCFLGLCEDL